MISELYAQSEIQLFLGFHRTLTIAMRAPPHPLASLRITSLQFGRTPRYQCRRLPKSFDNLLGLS
jgi:hypothetical protein